MEEAGFREGFLEEVAFQLVLERSWWKKLNAFIHLIIYSTKMGVSVCQAACGG